MRKYIISLLLVAVIATPLFATTTNKIHDFTTGIMHSADTISFTPTIDITSTNVQEAISGIGSTYATKAYVTGSTETALLTHTGNTTNPHGMTISNLPTLSGANTFTGTNNFTGPVSLTDGTNTSTIIPPFRTDKSKCELLVDFDNSLVDKTRGITPTGYSTANMWSNGWVNDTIAVGTATNLGGTFKTFDGDRGKFGGGIAVEESRTNLVYPDSTKTAGAWWLSATDVTADATKVSPAGYVDGLVYRMDSTSDAYKIVGTAVALANGSSITYSVWEKYEAGASLICISLSGGGDLATAAPASTYGKWIRSTVTYTNSSGGSQNVLIRHYNTNGSKYQIWGHQFEVGAFATSYIATTTAAVTRPTSKLSYSSSLIPASVGSVSFWVKFNHVPTVLGRMFMTRWAAFTDKYFFIDHRTDGKINFCKNISSEYITSTNTMPLNQWNHIVATYNGTSGKLYMNGVLEASGTKALEMTSYYESTFRLGNNALDEYDGCAMNNFTIFNHELTLAEIKQIYYSNQPVMCEGAVKKEDITRTFAGDPNNDFAPMYLNEMVWDSSGSKWYKSKGVLSNAAFDTGAWIPLN